jgi:hypothetical protein
MIERHFLRPNIYQSLGNLKKFPTVPPRTIKITATKNNKQQGAPYSRHSFQRPFSIDSLVGLREGRPMEDWQVHMKRGMILTE